MDGRFQDIEVAVLNQISHVIARQKNVSFLVKEVLDILYREMHLHRGTVTLLRDDQLFIEASHGLSDAEIKRGKYMIGEGITGKVAQRGKPIIIPDISLEPSFLDRTKSRGESKTAFICVPVALLGEIIGTLSIDYDSDDRKVLKRIVFLLETVANILANAMASIIKQREEHERLVAENERLKLELEKKFNPGNLVGNCSGMREVYAMIAQVADSPATVLIRGASGTGKELVARALHQGSSRRGKPFVAVNCAALPENLIESELFGHEKGSFTGAVTRRKGRCEMANGGTLFLDEIGDISLPVQVRLLRFLQEKNFERVGGNEGINVDVRVIAATSRDLEKLIAEGKFREDLYYRLNVFPIHLPALRQRRSDIMLLAEHFLSRYSEMYGKPIRRISTPAINMMMTYHWPGNVRELENCIERAVLTATDEVIHGYNMPPSLQTAQATDDSLPAPSKESMDFSTLVASYERELIVDALKLHRGNVAGAARHLKSSPRIIHYKIKNLGIEAKNYRGG